jgi:hypothetical protein
MNKEWVRLMAFALFTEQDLWEVDKAPVRNINALG